MAEAPKKRGRPPKTKDVSPDPREAASEASFLDSDEGDSVSADYSPAVMTNAYDAASTLPKPKSEAEQEFADTARTQPDDASYITTEHAEDQIEQAQYDAPPHEQGHGRRRGQAKVGELELAALKEDAWDVAHSQEETIRFDTTGRRWRFYPDQTITNEAIMVFEVRRGEDVREQRHSRAAYGTETAREQSDEIVKTLNGAL